MWKNIKIRATTRLTFLFLLGGLNGLGFCSLQLHFLSKWSFDDDATNCGQL